MNGVATTQREKPILFSGEMVRAILDGRKTQTRRVMKPQPEYFESAPHWRWKPSNAKEFNIGPFAVASGDSPGIFGQYVCGDRLWVRETFITGWPTGPGDELMCFDEDGNELPEHVWYRADPTPDGWVSNLGAKIESWQDEDGWSVDRIPWKPSIHMPRALSRLTLEITDVRVERVQDITEADAQYEGVQRPVLSSDTLPGVPPPFNKVHPMTGYYRDGFRTLWDSINAKRGFGWDVNPWVWVISFRRLP